jgi:hypothetical protein
MDLKKFITGTLVGGIAFFFLGYLFYGVLLAGFFSEHSGANASSMTMEEIVWWALVVGNVASGGLLSYIFLKWANISSFSGGASGGATIGFFIGLSMDLIRFATAGSFDLTASLGDVVVMTVMYGVAGGIIGATVGMGNKS